MKRILSFLLALAPLSAFAQFNGSGWYRAQSQASQRYLTVVDPKKIYRSGDNIFLGGLNCLPDFEDGVVCNPATICWFEQKAVSGSIYSINLIGQGLNFDQRVNGSASLNIWATANGCWLYGSGSGLTRYIYDPAVSYSPYVPYTRTGRSNSDLWNMLPVNSLAGQYFGIRPDVQVTADGSYWATLYAGFPFVPTEGMKVYTVSKVENGYAVIKEITGTAPKETPLLIRCAGSTVAQNIVTLKSYYEQVSGVGINYLRGNYYCYIDPSRKKEHNVLAYNATTMRMLGTDGDGRAAFVKSDIEYVPANKAYLLVNASTPATLKVVTEEEYTAGVETVTIDGAVPAARQGVYSLDGQRLGDTPDGLPKGIYIVNGKKVVIK